MNNFNNKSDRKFNKQVNHLQSFIGMPMWNGRNPSLSEIREYDRRLMEKQKQSVDVKKKGLFSFLFKDLKVKKLKTSSLITNAKKKTQKINQAMPKPINNELECCG